MWCFVGGLSLAIEGPSKADISCVDNQDGTCTVSYLPVLPGDYSILVKYNDKHIPGSPFSARITGNITRKNEEAYLACVLTGNTAGEGWVYCPFVSSACALTGLSLLCLQVMTPWGCPIWRWAPLQISLWTSESLTSVSWLLPWRHPRAVKSPACWRCYVTDTLVSVCLTWALCNRLKWWDFTLFIFSFNPAVPFLFMSLSQASHLFPRRSESTWWTSRKTAAIFPAVPLLLWSASQRSVMPAVCVSVAKAWARPGPLSLLSSSSTPVMPVNPGWKLFLYVVAWWISLSVIYASLMFLPGYGGLSLSIEGPSKVDINTEDQEDGTCKVTYCPTEPGNYIINIKFADQHVPGTYFITTRDYSRAALFWITKLNPLFCVCVHRECVHSEGDRGGQDEGEHHQEEKSSISR